MRYKLYIDLCRRYDACANAHSRQHCSIGRFYVEFLSELQPLKFVSQMEGKPSFRYKQQNRAQILVVIFIHYLA